MAIIFNRATDNLPLKFFDVGIEWNQHKIYRPDGFEYFHWLQTDAGMGIINIGNRHIKLGPQQGFLMRPNIPHSFFPDSSKVQWQTSFVTFSGSTAAELVNFLNLNTYQLYDHLDPLLAGFIRTHFDLFKRTDFDSTLSQSSAIYDFLMLLRKNAYDHQLTFTDDPVTNTIMAHVREHYRDPMTNEEFSRLTGYSVSHTNKLFREITGQTPLEYLTEFRLRTAKSLLRFRSDLTIKEIAAAAGFSSSSYFVQQFKQFFGVTPGQSRKNDQ